MGFEFVDPIGVGALAPGAHPQKTVLRLANDSADHVKLVRLLVGMADISHTSYPGFVIQQRTNLAQLGAPATGTCDIANLTALLGQVDVSLADLESLLAAGQVRSEYAAHLLEEFLWFFMQTERESHTTAFLHLYRALERASYAFPMAYAASSSDYMRTFDELRAFFTNAEVGELKFFRTFAEKVLDPPLLAALCEVDFTGKEFANKYCRVIKRCCNLANLTDIVPDESLSMEFRFLLELVINVRNRFFHFLSGKADKFSSQELPDSDRFFQIINQRLVNWLAVIYFRILSIQVA